jgi:hypothetical protein
MPDIFYHPSNLKLPTSDETLHVTILEGTAKSICKNILSVPVRKPGGCHSYSSLIDIISDIVVASGRDLDISDMFHLSNKSEVIDLGVTLHCQQIYQTTQNTCNIVVLLHLYITLWSDNFEPNNVKQNKASLCWVFTYSVSPPTNQIHTSANMYIISMGPKNGCHDILVWETLPYRLN